MKYLLWVVGVIAGTGIGLYLEWHTDEVTFVLAFLLLAAVLLGALNPRLAAIAGAVLGFSILAAHAYTENLGRGRPHYLHAPIAQGDWIAMMVLGVVVTAVAVGAGILRTRLHWGS